VLVDAGVLSEPPFRPDITRQEVAEAAGVDVEQLASKRDRGAALEAMGRGAPEIGRRLHEEGRLDALAGLGGTGGTAIVTCAMRRLPVGVPKLILSTVASGDTRPYVGASDVAMMYSVVDIAGVGLGRARSGRSSSPMRQRHADRACRHRLSVRLIGPASRTGAPTNR
jgi:uncharacterized protein (UPF0261 family)